MSGSELARFVAATIESKVVLELQEENAALKKKLYVQITGPGGTPVYFINEGEVRQELARDPGGFTFCLFEKLPFPVEALDDFEIHVGPKKYVSNANTQLEDRWMTNYHGINCLTPNIRFVHRGHDVVFEIGMDNYHFYNCTFELQPLRLHLHRLTEADVGEPDPSTFRTIFETACRESNHNQQAEFVNFTRLMFGKSGDLGRMISNLYEGANILTQDQIDKKRARIQNLKITGPGGSPTYFENGEARVRLRSRLETYWAKPTRDRSHVYFHLDYLPFPMEYMRDFEIHCGTLRFPENANPPSEEEDHWQVGRYSHYGFGEHGSYHVKEETLNERGDGEYKYYLTLESRRSGAGILFRFEQRMMTVEMVRFLNDQDFSGVYASSFPAFMEKACNEHNHGNQVEEVRILNVNFRKSTTRGQDVLRMFEDDTQPV